MCDIHLCVYVCMCICVNIYIYTCSDSVHICLGFLIVCSCGLKFLHIHYDVPGVHIHYDVCVYIHYIHTSHTYTHTYRHRYIHTWIHTCRSLRSWFEILSARICAKYDTLAYIYTTMCVYTCITYIHRTPTHTHTYIHTCRSLRSVTACNIEWT
jgi:hypothetical protein